MKFPIRVEVHSMEGLQEEHVFYDADGEHIAPSEIADALNAAQLPEASSRAEIIEECINELPGGDVCDPQEIADRLRALKNAAPPNRPGEPSGNRAGAGAETGAAAAPQDVPQTVWSAQNKTSCLLFATRADADKYAARCGATAGIQVIEVPICRIDERDISGSGAQK